MLYGILRDFDKCDPAAAGYTLSANSLRVMRNTPFAIKGYNFSSPELQDIFGREPWYAPRPGVDGSNPPELEPADKECVAKLRALEAR